MKLNEEQILHLADLLEMNIKEKQSCPHRLMTKGMVDDAIAFDKKLLELLEDELIELLQ